MAQYPQQTYPTTLYEPTRRGDDIVKVEGGMPPLTAGQLPSLNKTGTTSTPSYVQGNTPQAKFSLAEEVALLAVNNYGVVTKSKNLPVLFDAASLAELVIFQKRIGVEEREKKSFWGGPKKLHILKVMNTASVGDDRTDAILRLVAGRVDQKPKSIDWWMKALRERHGSHMFNTNNCSICRGVFASLEQRGVLNVEEHSLRANKARLSLPELRDSLVLRTQQALAAASTIMSARSYSNDDRFLHDLLLACFYSFLNKDEVPHVKRIMCDVLGVEQGSPNLSLVDLFYRAVLGVLTNKNELKGTTYRGNSSSTVTPGGGTTTPNPDSQLLTLSPPRLENVEQNE